MKYHYKEQIEKERIKQRLEDFEKQKQKEEEERRIRIAIKNMPTEPKLKREKRLKAEAEAKRIEKQKAWKERCKNGGSKLSFGHRRNGGGKKRSVRADDKDIVQARRALRRKENREKRKS